MVSVGGIDLNPKLLDLQIKRDGNGVPLPLPQQPIGSMNIQGFLPIIVDVTPVSSDVRIYSVGVPTDPKGERRENSAVVGNAQ